MSQKKRYGDPRKEAQERAAHAQGGSGREGAGSGREGGRSDRELSVGFIFFAWILFFAIWLAAGSLLVAALVFGVLLTAGIGVLNLRR
jgi:hypothetical protein